MARSKPRPPGREARRGVAVTRRLPGWGSETVCFRRRGEGKPRPFRPGTSAWRSARARHFSFDKFGKGPTSKAGPATAPLHPSRFIVRSRRHGSRLPVRVAEVTREAIPPGLVKLASPDARRGRCRARPHGRVRRVPPTRRFGASARVVPPCDTHEAEESCVPISCSPGSATWSPPGGSPGLKGQKRGRSGWSDWKSGPCPPSPSPASPAGPSAGRRSSISPPSASTRTTTTSRGTPRRATWPSAP
jgi:hypothetical protein